MIVKLLNVDNKEVNATLSANASGVIMVKNRTGWIPVNKLSLENKKRVMIALLGKDGIKEARKILNLSQSGDAA